MPAPQHMIDLVKKVHSDATRALGRNGADTDAVMTADSASQLLDLLDHLPPAAVDAIVSDVLRDFVGYLIAHPDGFRVGGSNTGDALIRAFVQYQEDRGFTVPEDELTVEGVVTSWATVLGHSQ